HDPLGRDALRDLRLDHRAEREARERERELAEFLSRVRGDAQQVLRLAPALVVRAFGSAYAAKIRPQRHVAELDESLRERLHNLVVQRSAVERRGVGDEGDAAGRARRAIPHRLDPACVARDEDALDGAAHIRRRSTTRPAWRCSSMISSMSARSTYVYQTASG